MGIAALLAGGTALALVFGAGLPAAGVATVGALFLGTMAAARLLAEGESRFRSRILRWAARKTRETWVEWGTGLYGLASLTCFLWLESRWLFEPESTPGEFLSRSIPGWTQWMIMEFIEALLNGLRALLWPLRLHDALGGILLLTAAVIGVAWVVRSLVWQGVPEATPPESAAAPGGAAPAES